MMRVHLQFSLNVVYLRRKHYQKICNDNMKTTMKFEIKAMGHNIEGNGLNEGVLL